MIDLLTWGGIAVIVVAVFAILLVRPSNAAVWAFLLSLVVGATLVLTGTFLGIAEREAQAARCRDLGGQPVRPVTSEAWSVVCVTATFDLGGNTVHP